MYNSKTDAAGVSDALNLNRSSNNCNMYKDVPGNDGDSVVVVSGSMASFTVMLKDHNLYVLTADSEPQRWELTYKYAEEDVEIQRIPSVEDGAYLAAVDEGAAQIDSSSGYISAGKVQYALISEEDYWNGVANYVLAH